MKTKDTQLHRMLPKEGNSTIQYNFYDSPFGKALIASTDKGICYIAFGEEKNMEKELNERYPKAKFVRETTDRHKQALGLFSGAKTGNALPLHVKGTDFQLKVWEALLQIPAGKTSTYKTIAQEIGQPAAVRAVGTAVGQNPVSYFIPCHRVIRTDGGLGGYHWGIDLKKQMLDKEK